jgi:hypothetical protein
MLYEPGAGAFSASSFAEVLVVRAPGEGGIFVEMRAEGFSLVNVTTRAALPAFVPNKWQHLVLRIPYGGTGNPRVEIEDAPAVESVDATPGAVPASLDVGVGLHADARDGTTGAVRLSIDNFRFTTE